MSSGALGNSLVPAENQYNYTDIRGHVQADQHRPATTPLPF